MSKDRTIDPKVALNLTNLFATAGRSGKAVDGILGEIVNDIEKNPSTTQLFDKVHHRHNRGRKHEEEAQIGKIGDLMSRSEMDLDILTEIAERVRAELPDGFSEGIEIEGAIEPKLPGPGS